MKNAVVLLVAFVFILLGCSGSDTYRGAWKATDIHGQKFELNFDAKTFSIKDSAGKTTNYKYSQNSIAIEGSSAKYRISVDGGRQFYVTFPNKNDETRGLIKDFDGNPIYAIGRSEYIKYEDMLKF